MVGLSLVQTRRRLAEERCRVYNGRNLEEEQEEEFGWYPTSLGTQSGAAGGGGERGGPHGRRSKRAHRHRRRRMEEVEWQRSSSDLSPPGLVAVDWLSPLVVVQVEVAVERAPHLAWWWDRRVAVGVETRVAEGEGELGHSGRRAFTGCGSLGY